MEPDHVACPRCRKRVRARAPHFPFCSDRCRLLDLGAWFAEDYRLSRPHGVLDDEEAFGEEGLEPDADG